MYDINEIDLLLGRPIQIHPKVFVTVPTVEEAIDNPKFEKSFRLFTIRTREIFNLERNVDALEEKYPTVWDFMWDEQTDKTFGKLFGEEEKTFTMVVMEALSFLTGLTLDGEEGFHKLDNGRKLVHLESDWIIDLQEFNNFCKLIKYMTAHKEPEDLAPKISSDDRHQVWLKTYKGRMNNRRRQGGVTWAGRMLILSVSPNGYIPLREIKDMTIFTFYQTFAILSLKDSYEINMDVLLSPKFSSKEGSKPPKHWKETYNTGLHKLS